MHNGRQSSVKSNFEMTDDELNQKDKVGEVFKDGRISQNRKKSIVSSASTNHLLPVSSKNVINLLNYDKDTKKKVKKKVKIDFDKNEVVLIESFKQYNQEMRFRQNFEIEIRKSDCAEECSMLIKKCVIF